MSMRRAARYAARASTRRPVLDRDSISCAWKRSCSGWIATEGLELWHQYVVAAQAEFGVDTELKQLESQLFQVRHDRAGE